MWKQIFKATFIAGSLDIIAAFIQAYLSRKTTPGIVLEYIASGIFGTDAFSGDPQYVIIGLLAHFFIAFMCALTYFILFPQLKFLHKSILLSSFLVSVIAWAVTTRIIVPLSKIQPGPFNIEKALIAVAILYFCIGIPITLFARSFYSNPNTK